MIATRPVHALIIAALMAYLLSLYPAILNETTKRGYDAPIYYRAIKGDSDYIITNPRGQQVTAWVYSKRLLPPLLPLSRLEYPHFLLLLHIANSIGVAALMAAALKNTANYPIIAGAAAIMVGLKASDIVAGGNITGLLAGISLTPVGALFACAVKPHYALALVLHSAAWYANRRRHTKICHSKE